MHTTTAPKRKEKGCTFIIAAPQRANILPIAVQIQLARQSKRHDKSRTRMKQKRDWQ